MIIVVKHGEKKKYTERKCYNFGCEQGFFLLKFGYGNWHTCRYPHTRILVTSCYLLPKKQVRVAKMAELSTKRCFYAFSQLCTLVTSLLGAKIVTKIEIKFLNDLSKDSESLILKNAEDMFFGKYT